MAIKRTLKNKKTDTKFVLDASGPANDQIFDLAGFEKFMHDRIKVNGRTANLASNVIIERNDDGTIAFTVSANVTFPKRYIKYLTKKFLKKHQLRDWLRVVATDKTTYELKYFNIAADQEAEEAKE